MAQAEPQFNGHVGRVFATTCWNVVTSAGDGRSEGAESALETLCRTYWYPIYVYVRRKGHRPDEAQDLTQEFFAQLIAKEHLKFADQKRGRFRNFLLGTLDHFLAREWSRAHRQKRGGQFTFVSLDEQAPEDRYRVEPADNETPERTFQRQWAIAILNRTMTELADECEASGKGPFFREVSHFLSGDRNGNTYAQVGRRWTMAEGAVRVAIYRFRQRYGELLRRQIAQTVSTTEEVDEELHYLLRQLSQE
jgi:DNA-directed RNA polymerase specialized sigma24 family protein